MIKIGDRFQWEDVIIEIINRTKMEEEILCIRCENGYGWTTGKKYTLIIGDWVKEGWVYLGNSSKSNKFKTIYDILNGND